MSRLVWLVTFVIAAPAALIAAMVALMITPTIVVDQKQVLSAATEVYAPQVSDGSSISAQVTAADGRALIIRNYLRTHNSSLEPFADEVVRTGDKYAVDPNLLIAIAQQESNLCKKIPLDSHNCWGFGIYGDKVTRFSSYPEALERVAATLKKKYIDQGLKTPEEIMVRYTPPSVEKGGPWASGIHQFLGELQ